MHFCDAIGRTRGRERGEGKRMKGKERKREGSWRRRKGEERKVEMNKVGHSQIKLLRRYQANIC